MAITDRSFERIKNNLPRVGIRGHIDSDQMRRTGIAYCVIDLLNRLPYHFKWGISYPTVDLLALAQDGLINIDAGPTENCTLIYKLLEDCMFFEDGIADWRILAMLDAAGYRTIRMFNDTDADCYWVRTIRGHFVVFSPTDDK